MRSSPSTFVSLALALLLSAWTRSADAQACCAGAGAVTPARLGLHDDAIAGVLLKAGAQLGAHAPDGAYRPTPRGAAEVDFEQHVFGAVRVLRRGQLGVLVPFVETHRRTMTRSETGGGLGDVNLSARYDFVRARESRSVPGIGLLLGMTLPTGTSAESAERPLATDATGVGAVQANAGVGVEQIFGSWLIGVSGIAALRAPRTVGQTRMALAPEVLALASAAYVFPSGASAALAASLTLEGDASANGVKVPSSARRLASLSLAASHPITDELRAVGSLFASPPLDGFGQNQLVRVGATLGLTHSFP